MSTKSEWDPNEQSGRGGPTSGSYTLKTFMMSTDVCDKVLSDRFIFEFVHDLFIDFRTHRISRPRIGNTFPKSDLFVVVLHTESTRNVRIGDSGWDNYRD